jgi:hypothetical protein
MAIIKVAFDIGGVLSRHTEVLRKMAEVFWSATDIFETHVLTDISKKKAMQMLMNNGLAHLFGPDGERVHYADYAKYGDNCKSVVLKEVGIDILFDDHMRYLMDTPALGLLVMPRPSLPYYSDQWKNSSIDL